MEILVAAAVSSVLLLILLGVVNQTTRTVGAAGATMTSFQSARNALNAMQSIVSQATLNTFLDYDSRESPTRYQRESAQQFVIAPAGASGVPGTDGCGQGIFFQAPAVYTSSGDLRGADGLLNVCGFYVEFGQARQPPHAGGTAPWRYRLMFLLTSAEANTVFHATGDQWFAGFSSSATPVADNIVALIVRPLDPSRTPPDLAPFYVYRTAETFSGIQPDWSHQLPPVVSVTLIAIDERSALQMENGSSQPAIIAASLAGKFQEAANFDRDLDALEQVLSNASPPVNFRVFTLNIPLKESKWSP